MATVDTLVPSGGKIKPILHYYDEYQTYDLLAAGSVFSPLLKALHKTFNAAFPSDYTTPSTGFEFSDIHVIVFLFERFIPVELPWCQDYSRKIYGFYKLYSGLRWAIELGEKPGMEKVFTGEYYGRAGNNGLDNYVFDLTDYVILPNLVLTYTPTVDETITLTWLAWEDNSFDADSLKYYPHKYSVASRQSVTLALKAGEAHSIEVQLPGFAICSMVCSGSSDFSFAIDGVSKAFLYSNLDALLGELNAQIDQQCPLLRQVVRTINGQYGVTVIPRPSPGDPDDYYITADPFQDPSLSDITFQTIPEWYHCTALFFANNDYWRNGVLESVDMGQACHIKTVSPYPSDTELYSINFWGLYYSALNLLFLRKLNSAPRSSGDPKVPITYDTSPGYAKTPLRSDTFWGGRYNPKPGRFGIPAGEFNSYTNAGDINLGNIYILFNGYSLASCTLFGQNYVTPNVKSNLVKQTTGIPYLIIDHHAKTTELLLADNIVNSTGRFSNIYHGKNNIPHNYKFSITYEFFTESEIKDYTQQLIAEWDQLPPMKYPHHLELDRP